MGYIPPNPPPGVLPPPIPPDDPPGYILLGTTPEYWEKQKPETSYGTLFGPGKPKRFEIEVNDDYSVMGGVSLTWRHYAALWIISDAIALAVVLWQLSSLKF